MFRNGTYIQGKKGQGYDDEPARGKKVCTWAPGRSTEYIKLSLGIEPRSNH